MLCLRTKINGYCLIVVTFCLLCQACTDGKGRNIPDVSDIELDTKVERFEKSLFSLDTNRLEQLVPPFLETHEDFSEVYLQIMSNGLPKGASNDEIIGSVVKPKPMRWLQDTCQIVFGNFEKEKEDFDMAFRLMKHYFPKKESPRIVTCITALNYGAFTIDDDILGLSLDFYLGKDFPFYQNLFPQYIARAMNKEHLVFRGMEAIVDDMLGQAKGNRMVDQMIHNGRKLYILDHLLPMASDTIKMQYTPDQLAWCKEHELEIWRYLLGEDLLYETDRQKFNKYINPSPNSPGMPDAAPGRTANWMGWQIVKAYMKRNPEKTLKDLLSLDDAQGLLNKSRYKP